MYNKFTQMSAGALLAIAMLGCGRGDLELLDHDASIGAADAALAESADGGDAAADAGAVVTDTDAETIADASSADVAEIGVPCTEPANWQCDGDERVRCVEGFEAREVCERGCLASPAEAGDAQCIGADAAWDCGSSEYQGQQYWTCSPDTGELHYCDANGGVVVRCPEGCLYGPLATDDSCLVPGGTVIPMPNITFNISGGLFTEADVRAPVEQGTRYLLDRVAKHIAVPAGSTIPDLTINYSPSSNTYCSGYAYSTSTDISCPSGYPITGASQNYVVNITIHEIGHIVAAHLVAPPSQRDTCENEGIATWMAGSYWSTTNGTQVDSLRTAARDAIGQGGATASMYNCVSASDAWYKVYGSYFEYLERFPGAIRDVSAGVVDKGTYTDGWAAWLAP